MIDSHLLGVNDIQESWRTKHFPISAFALFVSILSSLLQISQAADLLQTPEATITSLNCTGQLCTSNVDAVLGCIGQFCSSNTGPELQAEVLNDMAHIAFELVSFLTPEDFIVRFCTFIGKVCCLSVDCIPDHTVTTHKFIFQTVMLGVSANHFSILAVPFFKACIKTTTLQDHFAFYLLFWPNICHPPSHGNYQAWVVAIFRLLWRLRCRMVWRGYWGSWD